MCIVDKNSNEYYVTVIDWKAGILTAVDNDGNEVKFAFNQVDIIE